jgi:NAD(P)-dependent dehydrogenase (short-subunit alcohol dehydrogenase family)
MTVVDKVVIVTGAAGNLGSALVHLLLSRNARVAAVERTPAALDRLIESLGVAKGCLPLPGVDLGDPAACTAAASEVTRRLGPIDGLACTVGTFAMAGIEDAGQDHWDLLFGANLRTALNMCRAVVPGMRERKAGSIVTVGAGVALKAPAGMAAYAASKSAVLRLTESLAAELKGDGIRANCIMPSTLDTPQNRVAMPNADPSRWVTPMQAAEVMAFLLSDAGEAVNGAAIPVTGRG